MRKYPKLRKFFSERMKGKDNPAKKRSVRTKISLSRKGKRKSYSEERKRLIKERIHISRKIHEDVVEKKISEFQNEGYRVIPMDEGYPRPDLILIKGKDVKIYAFEIETKDPSVSKLEKYNDHPFYDDIIWFVVKEEYEKRIKEVSK